MKKIKYFKMKIINVLKNLIKNNRMTYSEYAENFLDLTQKDFDEVKAMFPDFDNELLKRILSENLLFIDSNKWDLIYSIILIGTDPYRYYIDDIEINGNQVTVYERLDVEEIGKWRQKVVDLLSNSNLTVVFE